MLHAVNNTEVETKKLPCTYNNKFEAEIIFVYVVYDTLHINDMQIFEACVSRALFILRKIQLCSDALRHARNETPNGNQT